MKIPLAGISGKTVTRSVKTTARPEEVYSLFRNMSCSAFLNSSLPGNGARFSYIAFDPLVTITSRGKHIRLTSGNRTYSLKDDPFNVLSSVLNDNRGTIRKVPRQSPMGIGYFSYELKNHIEKLPQKAADDLKLPEMVFSLYSTIITFDNKAPGKVRISRFIENNGDRPAETDLVSFLAETLAAWPKNIIKRDKRPGKARIRSNFTRASYIKAVNRILEHIKAGDIYQACLTQRFESSWKYDPYELYLRLNEKSPSPFSAYMNCDGFSVISSSPELFLKVRDRSIETRPMKGTRPRGKTKREDRKQKTELETSEKDKAELVMILDLERNDLGKICVPGSIRVPEKRRIETYPSVFQTIAVVKGLLSEKDPVKVLKAVFPGGSITGCPKIRAMEILDGLEPNIRGVCMGAIGYMDPAGTMELSVAIRTMVHKDDKVYFHAGGGIVADSDPEKEYEETLIKAKAMMRALGA